MSRMGCMKTYNSTRGLGAVKPPSKFPRVKKGIISHHLDIPHLTFEEWRKVTFTVKKNGVRIPLSRIPNNQLGLMYGAYLSTFNRKLDK